MSTIVDENIANFFEKCELGDLDQVKVIYKTGHINGPNLNYALQKAAYHGHLHIAELLIEKGANTIDGAMHQAICGHNLNIVKYLIQNGARNFNQGLFAATVFKNLEIIKELILSGARDFNRCLQEATSSNNLELVKFFIENGATNVEHVLYVAAVSGFIGVARWIVDNDKISDFKPVIKMCLDNYYFNAPENHCLDASWEILKLIIEKHYHVNDQQQVFCERQLIMKGLLQMGVPLNRFVYNNTKKAIEKKIRIQNQTIRLLHNQHNIMIPDLWNLIESYCML